MTRGPLPVAALAVALGLGVAGVATSQNGPAGARVDATEAATAPALPKPEDFKPSFDDLMTMLVQPRHLKLYYAGIEGNWELAAAESRNLRQAFGRISRMAPDYLGIDVAEAIEAMMTAQLQAVDAAVAAGDPARFTNAYDGLTNACNACHVYMERPYIAVKVPNPAAPPAYPAQDFSRPR